MHDDLIGLLLGCGCRRKCCCKDEGKDQEGARPAPSTLFQSAGRTRPQVPHDDDSPFIPPLPSWDTPQRPSTWGDPITAPDGTFGTPTPSDAPIAPWGILSLFDDQAQAHGLNFSFAVDHDARQVMRRTSTLALSSGLSPGAAPFPWRYLAERQPGDLTFPPVTSEGRQTADGFARYRDVTSRSGGTTTRTLADEVLHFSGQQDTIVAGQTSAGGTIYAGQMDLWYRKAGEDTYVRYDPAGYRLATIWSWNGEPTPPGYLVERVTQIQARVTWMEGTQHEDWLVLYQTTRRYVRPGEAAEAGYVSDRTEYTPITLSEEEQPGIPPDPAPPGPRFTAAAGAVQVLGPHNRNPARLRNEEDAGDATLRAWGHTFTGGSWAALRDHPDGVVVLHERGDVVTALRPDSVETCPRELFEREVLRCEPGAFRQFTDAGSLFTSWPHPWAMADCTAEVRAVVAHEPWRDSTRRRAAGTPASWAWPGRPGRRPRVVPGQAPRPVLGLTLATVLPDAPLSEPLKRQESPLRLPSLVDVWRGGAWAGDAAALRALRKRVLYQPAGWAEELDDRSSVRGRLRLHYPYDTPTPGESGYPQVVATLLLRGRRPREALEVTVRLPGRAPQVVAAQLLGHNAPEARGWHPYVLPLGPLPPGPVVVELTTPAPLSRALLALRVIDETGSS
ncbi:hypothetical protein [uncultured Deinococcus sp.]|uniref:hypothetical protein n=1 Tax=uncultured Deinococcus sp. TaxID=158789 RepID=UPI00258A62EE|nr:hypothetical protein [uncultured Deinococcus sp.]